MHFKKLISLAFVLICGYSMSNIWQKYRSKTTTVPAKFESVVLKFIPGSTSIRTSEYKHFLTTIKRAASQGRIVKTELVVWPDKEHPKDRKLAEARIKSMKKILQKKHYTEITSFNMAENNDWEKSNNNPRLYSDLIKDQGAPSKAIVVLKIQEIL